MGVDPPFDNAKKDLKKRKRKRKKERGREKKSVN